MKPKNLTIRILTIVILGGIILWTMSNKTHDWDLKYKSDGTNPHDLALIDDLLERSLDNGYSVRQLDTLRSMSDTYLHPAISQADTDTALLVIHGYDWCGYDNDNFLCDIDVVGSLMDLAARGGKAIYVMPPTGFFLTSIFDDEYDDRLTIIDYFNIDGIPYYEHTTMSETWYASRTSEPILIKSYTPDMPDVAADSRFTPYRLLIRSGVYRHGDVRFSLEAVWACDSYNAAERVYDIYESDEFDEYPANVFCARVSFPQSGGVLYLTSLAPYFTNLVIDIPEGYKVVEGLMSRIDDRPVARIDYPHIKPKTIYDDSDNGSAADPLTDFIMSNPSLRLVWMLLIAFALLLLARGLMRIQPPSRAAAAELKHRDAVTEGAHRLRKSPLLNFLYQCSWLYTSHRDYAQLIEINCRRLGRTVTHYTGIELSTATNDQILEAATYFAGRSGRNIQAVADQLTWMRDIVSQPRPTGDDYRKSQQIVEEFPML